MRKDLEELYPRVVDAFQAVNGFGYDVKAVLLSEAFKDKFEVRYKNTVGVFFASKDSSMLRVLSKMRGEMEALYGSVHKLEQS